MREHGAAVRAARTRRQREQRAKEQQKRGQVGEKSKMKPSVTQQAQPNNNARELNDPRAWD